MGRKADQDAYSFTCRPEVQSVQSEAGANPDTVVSTHVDPPPYSENAPSYHSQPLSHSWSSQDPRSSSTQSLVPHISIERNGKRTLLLVYIHGFMGNETSFQSFPAHVHNLVTEKLKGTHVVHTKIYPKYKSRKDIRFVRDGFGEW